MLIYDLCKICLNSSRTWSLLIMTWRSQRKKTKDQPVDLDSPGK